MFCQFIWFSYSHEQHASIGSVSSSSYLLVCGSSSIAAWLCGLDSMASHSFSVFTIDGI